MGGGRREEEEGGGRREEGGRRREEGGGRKREGRKGRRKKEEEEEKKGAFSVTQSIPETIFAAATILYNCMRLEEEGERSGQEKVVEEHLERLHLPSLLIQTLAVRVQLVCLPSSHY